MLNRIVGAAILAIFAALGSAAAQTPDPPPPPPATDQAPPPSIEQPPPPPPAAADQTPPPTLNQTASTSLDRRDTLPSINVYLPEGQASIRLKKLIRNVLFESQIDYKFVEGDISTYLRYKYYARNYTYRIGVFDSIEFPEIGGDSQQEFERVRGGLLLVGVPRDYNNRYFWLLQNDRLTFGDPTNVDNRQNNIYTKVGYQYGTQFDERMNAIVGESRGRITPVLTAFRDIGPQNGGLAAALTVSGNVGVGDYSYSKLETEGLRRFDLTETMFIVSRVHIGAFLTRNTVDERRDEPEVMRYSIPRYELFPLGGREALRSIGDEDDARGTHEIHTINDLFVPIFRNRDYRIGAFHWTNMYGIAYVGAGTVGFRANSVTDSERFVIDGGLGTEMSITVRDIDILFSFIYARNFKAPDDLEGGKFRFSIRTIR